MGRLASTKRIIRCRSEILTHTCFLCSACFMTLPRSQERHWNDATWTFAIDCEISGCYWNPESFGKATRPCRSLAFPHQFATRISQSLRTWAFGHLWHRHWSSHLVMAVKLSACQLDAGKNQHMKNSSSHVCKFHLEKLTIFPKPLEECQLPRGVRVPHWQPLRSTARPAATGPSAFSDLIKLDPLRWLEQVPRVPRCPPKGANPINP